MPETLVALHAIADALSLVALIVLAWAALLFFGPLACAALVLMRAAGQATPPDAPLLFLATAGSWALAFTLTMAARAIRGAWRSMRQGALERAARRGQDAGQRMRSGRPVGASRFGGRRPGAFSFSLRDPWVAWAAAEAERLRREGAGQVRAERARTRPGAAPPPPRGERQRSAPPPRPEPPRAPEPDPHAVLGVPRGASADAIRKAYRELVKKHHPDKVTDRSAAVRRAAHQKIVEIRRAYEALKEPRRR